MLKKFSAAAALVVIFAFLSVSIAHACPDLGVMPGQSVTSKGITTTKDPCHDPKGDFCKSVRDSILSIQPSFSVADNLRQAFLLSPLFIERPTAIVFSLRTHVVDRPFHPVFKLQLTLSYLVLRI